MKSFFLLLMISLGLNAYVSRKVYVPDENHPPPHYETRQAEEERTSSTSETTKVNREANKSSVHTNPTKPTQKKAPNGDETIE